MRPTLSSLMAACLVLSFSCGRWNPWKAQVQHLKTKLNDEKAGMSWGGDPPFLNAVILDSKAQAIPKTVHLPGVVGESSYTVYDVVCLATVQSRALDLDRYRLVFSTSSPSLKVRFDVVSDYGLLLGSTTEQATLHSPNGAEMVGARFSNLSPEEAKLVDHVEVSLVPNR